MSKTILIRFGLLLVAVAAIVVGLNLMNVRNDIAVGAGFVAIVGGFALGGRQVWDFYRGIEK